MHQEYVTRKIELMKNPPSFKQHQDLPEDLRTQLDLMHLHYWPECRALFCKACKPDVKNWRNQRLCRNHVLPHLRRYHGFEDGLPTKALGRCLDKLLGIAATPDQLLSPVPGLLPRDFLEPPINGWLCLMCGFATDDIRSSENHFKSRHNATPSKDKLPPRLVLVQHVDRDFFDVKGDLLKVDIVTERKFQKVYDAKGVVPTLDFPGEVAQVKTDDVPDILHYWAECHAFICKSCESRPILCRRAILDHVQEYHANEDGFQNLEALGRKLNKAEQLAQEPENIRLPGPWLGIQSFLQPPVFGYACSAISCGYASEKLDDVKKHESTAHPGGALPTCGWKIVMIQYVTLAQRIYFPVLRFGHRPPPLEKYVPPDRTKDNERGSKPGADIHYQSNEDSIDYQQYLTDLKASSYTRDKAWALFTRPMPEESEDSEDRRSVRSRRSVMSGMTTTHRSLFNGENEDTYTTKQRFDILASLWDTPSEDDLHPLNDFDVQKKIRALALRAQEQAINQVKRFDTVFRQALLYTQHEIVIIEEALSKGIHIPSHVLRKVLIEYSESS